MGRNSTEVRQLLEEELIRARQKHQNWPTDTIHRAMILLDQAGGIAKEAFRCIYSGGHTGTEYLEKEVLHTAVVCIRWLEGG